MPRKKRKGKTTKKNQNKSGGPGVEGDKDEHSKAPHSFVIHRGKTGKCVQELTSDIRKVMEPYTASNIKVRPKNVIKDFVHVAGVLNVSHMVMFTRTQVGAYMKISRFPRGPTMTFRVNNYTLSRDVRSALKRQVTYDKQFDNHPLLILNGFTSVNDGGEEEDKETKESNVKKMGGREIGLVASMFQNMFPSINVTTVKVNSIRRCVLLNFDSKTQSIQLRHYTIKVVPVGMSKPLKKIVQGKIPNLSRYQDMSEYLAGGGGLSESEAEDDPEVSRVTLPHGVTSRGNIPSQQSSVRLVELGPRLTLNLIKIEEGLLDGEVLYHRLVEKSDEEKKASKVAREKRRRDKEKRKNQQETNVKKKEQDKENLKQKSLEGMMKKKLKNLQEKGEELPAQFQGVAKTSGDSDSTDQVQDVEGDDDTDEEWYRKEVGEEPEKDLFGGKNRGRKREASNSNLDSRLRKRFKKSTNTRNSSRDGHHQSSGKNTRAPPKFKVKLQANDNFSGKMKHGQKSGMKNNHKPGGGNRDKKKKRPTQVFDSQGVGPNFRKNSANKRTFKSNAFKKKR